MPLPAGEALALEDSESVAGREGSGEEALLGLRLPDAWLLPDSEREARGDPELEALPLPLCEVLLLPEGAPLEVAVEVASGEGEAVPPPPLCVWLPLGGADCVAGAVVGRAEAEYEALELPEAHRVPEPLLEADAEAAALGGPVRDPEALEECELLGGREGVGEGESASLSVPQAVAEAVDTGVEGAGERLSVPESHCEPVLLAVVD